MRGWPILEKTGSKSVGTPSGLGKNFERLASWNSALKSLASPNWDALCQASWNRLTSVRRQASLSDERAWANVLKEIKSAADDFLESVEYKVAQLQGPLSLGPTVSSYIVFSLAEQEYSDLTPPFLFSPIIMPILQAGYLPCGWEGRRLSLSEKQGGIDVLPAGPFLFY